MKRFLMLAVLALALVGVSDGAGRPAPSETRLVSLFQASPPKQAINLPELKDGEIKLGELYVADSAKPFFVKVVGDDSLTVEHETGPIRVNGHFAGGGGKRETRTFAGPVVKILSGKGSGRTNLIVVPGIVEADTDVRVVPLAVNNGTPPPVTPPVVDPVAQALATAYAAETATDKAKSVADLAGFYRGAAASYVPDKQVKTWGDFSFALKAGREKVIDNKIPLVRKVLSQSVFDPYPEDSAKVFDDTQRKLAADLLLKAATLLENLR